jgi:hypothetical protein
MLRRGIVLGDHIDHISDVAEVTIMVELVRGACNFSEISWLSPRVFKMACNFCSRGENVTIATLPRRENVKEVFRTNTPALMLALPCADQR